MSDILKTIQERGIKFNNRFEKVNKDYSFRIKETIPTEKLLKLDAKEVRKIFPVDRMEKEMHEKYGNNAGWDCQNIVMFVSMYPKADNKKSSPRTILVNFLSNKNKFMVSSGSLGILAYGRTIEEVIKLALSKVDDDFSLK